MRVYFFLIAFIVGLIHTWSGRYTICGNGLPYLDIGDAYFRGDWNTAINSFWSPLYSWAIGFAFYVFKPVAYWESTFIHFVNFIIYFFALICFDFFLCQLIKFHKEREIDLSKSSFIALPEYAWLSFGYALFIWSSMNLVTISEVGPDMFVCAFVYLLSGIMFKIKLGTANWFTYIVLGIVLSFGYFAKAILFPLAFIYFTLVFFLIGKLKAAISKVLISLVVFLAVVTPFIFIISKSKGYFTISETPRVVYAWDLNRDTNECPKTLDTAICGKLNHPPKKIFNKPAVYEYQTTTKATDPLWQDMSYWYDGLKPRFTLKGQLIALLRSAKEYFNLFFNMQSPLLVVYCILFFLGFKNISWFRSIQEQCILLIPSISAFALYSLSHAELRYLGSFNVLLWLALFSGIKLSDSPVTRKILSSSITLVVIFMLVTSFISRDLLENYRVALGPNIQWQVACELKKLGFKEWDKTAVVLYNNDYYWARLAKMQVVAEINEPDDFWAADDGIKLQVLRAVKNSGAKIIVADEGPSYTSEISKINWRRIENTSYFFYVL